MVLASELLLEEKVGELTDKQKKLTGIIREDCSRLQELVGELLDISKLEAGKMEFHMVPVSLTVVLTTASVSLVPLFKDKNVELTIEDTSTMPEVEADPKKLVLVLNNLLMNALRYTDEGGSVKVSSEAEDGFVRVSVTDTGIGIPVSMQKKVFEKFFQGRWDEKHRTGGAGMGLALVKEIVEAMSGSIELESEEGRGSKFSFTLKAAPPSPPVNGVPPIRVAAIASRAKDSPMPGSAALSLDMYIRAPSPTRKPAMVYRPMTTLSVLTPDRNAASLLAPVA